MKSKRIELVSRFFEPLNQGAGRLAEDLNYYLRKDYNVVTSSCWSKKIYSYVLWNWGTRFFTKKNADVHLAVTSMESNYIPKDKSIVIVCDLIPLLYTLKCTTHYNAKFHNVILAYIFFYQTIMKAKECKRIICISEETKKDFVEVTKCDESKIRVIDCMLQEKYKYQKPFNNNKVIIGTISAVDKRKRSDILIKEFMKITDDNLELRIGGSGALLDECKELAKNDKRIKFAGFVKEEHMLNFYQELDVFIFPSSQEGFGIPIIEAIAVGRPVITIKDSNIPKKVMSLTKEIEWGDLRNEIYNSLWDLGNKELQQKSKYVQKEFSVKKVINQYKEVINEI